MPTDEDTARRLVRLRRRPNLLNYDDDFLIEVLEESSMYFEAYCNHEDEHESIDGIILDLAILRVNQLGAEGATKAEDGGIKRDYPDGIPAMLRKQLNNHRRIIV